jgi:asparagine synthase (glutamine-hydrolysing)
MCGICGVVQIRGDSPAVVSAETLDHMTDSMAHRGPNDRGTHIGPGIAMGARRLSIVDVEGGHQPFSNEDGTVWAIQNGELYNHDAVRRSLQSDGHRFASRCDTEILPHMYEREGVAFAEQLRGMFGLAVWDARERRLVVARDRLGIKPMYYAVAGDALVFGSELKSVLASGLVDAELDFEAIDAYLALGYFPAPLTPLAGVHKLLPGHRLIVDALGVRTEAFWTYPQPRPGPRSLGLDHYARELLEELETSVRLRLMADVPLGAMLSGGIDSSLIVALMARNMSEPVKTFSIGFREATGTNELADARLVANAFGTEHHELELSFNDAAVDLADLTWYMDEPIADLSSLGFLALSGLAAQQVTVALSGQGADELLGGYLKHRAAALCGTAAVIPPRMRQLLASGAASGPKRLRRAARTLGAVDPARRVLEMSSKLDPSARAKLAIGPLAGLDGGAALRAISRLAGTLETDQPLGSTLYLDGQLALVDDMLHYFDRASMAHSLEVRVPFLDHHVVEFAATIPDSMKVRRLVTKAVLKHAARGVIPDRIIDKPKLGFFREEVGDWFRAQTSGAVSDYLLGPSPNYEGFLDREGVERLVHRHASGADSHNQHLLLAILMLEVWLATYLPRARPRTAAERERITIRTS